MEMHPFYQVLDPYLIYFYRLTGHVGVDFVIGTLVLAGIAMLIGEVSVFLAFRFTRKRFGEKTAEAEKYQNLSMDALKAGNKEAYQATNKLANDAFGHSFFQQLTLSAAFLWPVFFALAWMQYRFLEVEFPIPGTNWSLGFIGGFIIIYIAAYLALKRLPWFRRLKGILESYLNNGSVLTPEISPKAKGEHP
ncbi:MAG: hypothetical protein HY790_06085 [Deltaproteobacteria bacterium]|nr:hypothetical protein [Deltaproteobacteria bacterium]MBI4795396.1 hypothetical protein [Deltaproteobacteria bacterium]